MSTRSGHILVVDDVELNRMLLVRHLQKEGHTYSTADNGRKALAMLMMRQFDLVLLDIMMPEMTGIQLLEKLQADDNLKHVPVIVISAVEDMDDVVKCIEMGAWDYLTKPFNPILLRARINACLEKKFLHDHEYAVMEQLRREKKRADDLLQLVIPLGVALSAERDFDRLLEMILIDAKKIAHADGGTLYLKLPDESLKFEILRNDTLGLAMGGTSGKPITFPPIRLYDATTGEPNHHNVATHCAITALSVNVPDAYRAEGFDFSGTRAFDRANNYRSKSFLTIPLKNHRNEVIGVLQLINAKNPDNGQIIAFDQTLQWMVESLSSLATVALESYLREQKLQEQIQELQIVIDETKKQKQVSEITDNEHFQELAARAAELRARRKK